MSIVVGSSGQMVSSLRDLNAESQNLWVPVEWVEAKSVVNRLTDGSSVEGVVPTIGASDAVWLRSILKVRDARSIDLASVIRLETIVARLREFGQSRLSDADIEHLVLLQVWLIARRVRLASLVRSAAKSQSERGAIP